MEKFILANNQILDSQKRALKHISTLKDGDISLIRGGPGTGKTFTILSAAQMIAKTGKRVSIVLPDEKTLKNFIEQIDYLPLDKSIRRDILLVDQIEFSDLSKNKDLSLDLKSLKVFLDRPDLADPDLDENSSQLIILKAI